MFDVYQWPQKMFDGSVKTFEMVRRLDTVQVIGVKNGQLVVTLDEQPNRPARLQFPGGRPEPGDASWLETAKREMREETGFSFSSWRLIQVIQTAPKLEHFVPIFLAQEPSSEEKQNTDHEGERITVMLKSFDEVRDIALSRQEPTLNYMAPLFAQVNSLAELLALPEFQGREVDR